MEEDILRKMIRFNSNESEFYLACLEHKIKKNNNKISTLKHKIVVIKFLETVKNVDETKFNEQLENFYNKKINKSVRYKDIIDIKRKDDKIYFKIKQTKYLPKNFFQSDDEPFDIVDNIHSKIIIAYMINFEGFFNNLLKLLITENEKFFFDKDAINQKLSYEEILKNPFTDFKGYIINKQIEKLSYDVINTLNFLLNRMDCEDIKTEFATVYNSFIEIYYRRNLIIHNNGLINEIYLSKIKNNDDLKVGSKINITNEYVKSSEGICNIFACLLYAVFGQLIKNDDKKNKYYSFLEKYSFSLLIGKKWKEALVTQKLLFKYFSKEQADKLNFKYNIYNCRKQLSDNSYITDLEKVDDSALSPIYKVAKLLLLNKNEEVVSLLEEHFPKDITQVQVLHWPIFVDFRDTEEFKLFKLKHSDEFSYMDIE